MDSRVLGVRSRAEIGFFHPGILLVPSYSRGKRLDSGIFDELFHRYGLHEMVSDIGFRFEGKFFIEEFDGWSVPACFGH